MKTFQIDGIDHTFVVFDTIGDGSCFIHSVLHSFNKEYRDLDQRGRRMMVAKLRSDLSDVLSERSGEKTYYEKLSRGQIKELSEALPEMKLQYMQRYLKSRNWITMFYLELISDQLDIDIVIIDEKTKKVYQTGDKEIYYKNRETVIINYIEDAHFESVGVKVGSRAVTLFSPECELILKLKKM